ncbi:MAG: aminopeptidase [Terrisporobacter sp.]|uniref:aminopeptidase n=1 Tax=Terrisporobacter sp. TaxID=1965305 RepID=UPI002FC7FEBF
MDFNRNLEKYAELAIKVGVNIQPNQTLLIRTPIQCADFVRYAVKFAYENGARNVFVEWSDEQCSLSRYLYAPNDVFNEFPQWVSDQYVTIAKEGGAFLSIHAQDPDLLKDIDPQRISNYQKASGIALKEWRSYTLTDKCKWSIVSVPTEPWAHKIFPDVSSEEAVKKLWGLIFKCTRVDTEDPVASWMEHNKNLQERTDFLNRNNFKTLKYKSSKTDLTIGLPENHTWESGASVDPDGVNFNPNMPTEEIFTLPHKYQVEGVVHSSKPLVYGGNVIDDFTLTFKEGEIIECSAAKGEKTLKNLIATDEGSHYLGEVALVPYKSPISDTNVVFYNTLYDENASCHLALGSAYATCIKGGADLPREEYDAYGINDSLTHVDFMIGSPDLDIVGITYDGEEIQIFKDGNWAF